MILFASYAMAQDEMPMKDVAGFTTKFREQSKQTTSIQADFKEEKRMSVLKETEKSEGKFYFKKTDKLRWEKNGTKPFVFLTAGSKVRLKDGGIEKEVSSFNQVASRIKELMLSLVNGEFQNNKAFLPTYFETNTGFIIRLKPRSKRLSNQFEYIQLVFSKKTMLLDELAFYEKNGDTSRMKFYNQRRNESLDDNLFLNF